MSETKSIIILSASASFKDHLVGPELVADYLLFRLNKSEEFGYVTSLGLQSPTDCIHEVLLHIAAEKNARKRIRDSDGWFTRVINVICFGFKHFNICYCCCTGTLREFPDFQLAATVFLNQFRKGNFGRILLDKDRLFGDAFGEDHR